MKTAVKIFLVILFCKSALFGYTRVYLYSEVETDRDEIYVSDICKMEGDDIALLSNLQVSRDMYIDGIVSSNELLDFMKNSVSGQIFIFGNGVRIKKNTKEIRNYKEGVIVGKGEEIGLSVRKNGIVIEVTGKAMKDGKLNDEINFRLSNGRIVRGKIVSSKIADVNL